MCRVSIPIIKLGEKSFLAQGGNGEEEDEVGEWRGRRSDILDIREGGDTIRWKS